MPEYMPWWRGPYFPTPSGKLSGNPVWRMIIIKEYFPINGFGTFRITCYNFTPMAFRPGTMQGIVFMNFSFFKGDAYFMGKEDRFFILDTEGLFYPLECLPRRNIEGGNNFVRNCQHSRRSKVKAAFGKKRVLMTSLNALNISRAWRGPGRRYLPCS